MRIENIHLIKKIGRKSLGKYFYKFGVWFLFFRYKNRSPLLVYQMGKVGSNTILESLKRLELGVPIFHVHNLTKEGLVRVTEKSSERIKRNENKLFLEKSRYLSKFVNKYLYDKHWNIVTLVRDPIARNIGSFFHSINNYIPDGSNKIKCEMISIENLIKIFLEKFPHDEPLIWFDSELKAMFNIDVFSDKFPIEKGYKIYRGDYANVMLLKLEYINLIAKDAFKEFLQVDDMLLVNRNMASQKYYHETYRKFKQHIELPIEYVNKLYNSKYMQHFYSKEEIDRFKSKWIRRDII